MAYHTFNKSANVASMSCVHYENVFNTHTAVYDYISTCHYEQLTTNLNNQHDLLVELENFYDHVDQNSVKRAIGMFTINMSKTTYVVYFISNQYFPQC